MKKAPAFETVALMRLTIVGLQNPVAEFAATGKPYRRARLLATKVIDRLSLIMSIAVMGGSPQNRVAASVVLSDGRHARTRQACRSASGPGVDHCRWLPSSGPPTT